jgi:hypothetical protein
MTQSAVQPRHQVPINGEAFAKGRYLMVRRGTTLPARCALCNRDVENPPTVMTFVRFRWWLFLAFFAAPLLFVIVLLMRKVFNSRSTYAGGVVIHAYFCPRHQRRSLYCWGSMIVLLAGAWIATAWLIFTERHPDQYDPFIPWLLPTLPTIVCGWALTMLVLGDWNPWFTASRFEGAYVYLKGSSRKFRESLPPSETSATPRPQGFEVVMNGPPKPAIPVPPRPRLTRTPGDRRPPEYPKTGRA